MISFPQGPKDSNFEGIPPNSEPVIVDKHIWEIAKKVEVENDLEVVYWATVVKIYREMGGRIEFRPRSSKQE